MFSQETSLRFKCNVLTASLFIDVMSNQQSHKVTVLELTSVTAAFFIATIIN